MVLFDHFRAAAFELVDLLVERCRNECNQGRQHYDAGDTGQNSKDLVADPGIDVLGHVAGIGYFEERDIERAPEARIVLLHHLGCIREQQAAQQADDQEAHNEYGRQSFEYVAATLGHEQVKLIAKLRLTRCSSRLFLDDPGVSDLRQMTHFGGCREIVWVSIFLAASVRRRTWHSHGVFKSRLFGDRIVCRFSWLCRDESSGFIDDGDDGSDRCKAIDRRSGLVVVQVPGERDDIPRKEPVDKCLLLVEAGDEGALYLTDGETVGNLAFECDIETLVHRIHLARSLRVKCLMVLEIRPGFRGFGLSSCHNAAACCSAKKRPPNGGRFRSRKIENYCW